MSAHTRPAFLAIELNEASGARELVLRDRSGLVPEELIFDGRESHVAPERTALSIEIDGAVGIFHATPMQLRTLAALCSVLADEADVRRMA